MKSEHFQHLTLNVKKWPVHSAHQYKLHQTVIFFSSLSCFISLFGWQEGLKASKKCAWQSKNWIDSGKEGSKIKHTHIQPFYGSVDFVRGNLVSRYQKKHSSTHTHHGHQISLSASSIYYDPWDPPYSIHVLSTISLQVFFGLPLGLAPSTSYSIVSSPNHYLLFAAHAHTIATCFADNDISLLVSNGTKCLNLFHPKYIIIILVKQ